MFYTYVWLREDDTPYYVGKGKGNRAFTSSGHRVKCPPLNRTILYLAKSEQDAFETEIDLIWYYGRKDLGTGCLRNLTDGGENPPRNKRKNFKHSENTRLKMSASAKVKVFTKEHRKHMGKKWFGNKLRKGLSSWNKGLTGLVAWNKGIPCTEETKAKIRETKRNRRLIQQN